MKPQMNQFFQAYDLFEHYNQIPITPPNKHANQIQFRTFLRIVWFAHSDTFLHQISQCNQKERNAENTHPIGHFLLGQHAFSNN